MKKNKIILIATYFGILPSYFDAWLISCAKNEKIDFLFITDQRFTSNIPNNVKVILFDLIHLKEKIKIKLSLKDIALSPYKICDFRPAFAHIFDDEIKEYDYWGYTDIDVMYGNLFKFLEMYNYDDFDKIFQYGHLTILKNSTKINEMYKSTNTVFSYKAVFGSIEHYAFDEKTGINYIAKKNNIKVVDNTKILNCSRKHKDMIVNESSGLKNYKKQIFVWENGEIFHIYKINNVIIKEEYMYLHFQWKKPKFYLNSNNDTQRYLISNLQIKQIEEINDDLLDIFGTKYNIYSLIYEKVRFFMTRILYILKRNKKQRNIWIKQHLSKRR